MILSKKKTKSTIVLILLLTLSTTITLATEFGLAQAIDIPTFLFVTASPDPVGIGQTVYVGITFSKPPPTSSGSTGDLYEDVTLEIINPDGGKTTYGPYLASMAAGVTFNFTPDKVGNYTMQAFYPGQVLTGTNPLNPITIGGNNRQLIGSNMLPTESNIKTLTVTENPVEPIYQTPPLPTEYWTRPIYATNWEWGQIGSNWFGVAGSGAYDASGNVLPSGPAPNSAHIVWTKATQFGGQPGSPINSDSSTAYSSVSLLQNYFKPVTILNGILYYNKYAALGTLIGWEAIDVHTGKVLWDLPAGITGAESISYGQIVNYNNFQEFGSNAFLWSTPGGGGFGATGGSWMGIYDAYTGTYLANVTNPISVSRLIDYDSDIQGTVIGYYVSGGNLCLYNTTELIISHSGMGAGFVRPSGTINGSMAEATEWKTPLPTTFNGDSISLSIAAVTPEVILMRQVPGAVSWQGTTMGYQYVAGYDAKTGAKLWGPINQTLPQYEDTSILCAKDGYYVMHNKDRDLAWGYSLTTGQMLWGPVQLKGGGDSAVWRDGEIAYGKVYIFDLGGYVNAIDLETGKIAWTFYAGDAGYDTPFESYPIFGYNAHSIADGKLFLSEGIMYTPPLHPSYRLAINCTDGSLVWKILQYSSTCVGPVGDGYLISWNSFDNQIYSFGMGPTVTTVSASPKVSAHGSSVIIEGTVIDTSGGTTQDIITTRFPNGLPAVSDDSMEAWMEYAYQQQIKPTNATGVPVNIDVLDSNGNYRNIGTTTSDANGQFSFTWTPDIPGDYTVTTSFLGTESYYPSSAEAFFTVSEPVATPLPTATTEGVATTNDLMMYLVPSVLAIIIAIAIVGVVIVMTLRKRP
jgi:hypothetical protein